MLLFELLPVLESFAQLLAIDLDPFSPQEYQAFGRLQQSPAFLVAEWLAVESQVHLKIEEVLHGERAGPARADMHVDLGPWRPARRAPIGNAAHDARLLDTPRLQ